jgi:hypothetical protein
MGSTSMQERPGGSPGLRPFEVNSDSEASKVSVLAPKLLSGFLAGREVPLVRKFAPTP